MKRNALISRYTFINAVVIGLFTIFVLSAILTVRSRIKKEIRVSEINRIRQAIPLLFEFEKQKISNMLNSYAMWSKMVKKVKKRDTQWLRKQFLEDYQIGSQFDSFGVYNEKAEAVFVEKKIIKPEYVKSIVEIIKSKFKYNSPAEPIFFFYKTGINRIFIVGVCPLSNDFGYVKSYGFVYFSKEIGPKFIYITEKVTSSQINIETQKSTYQNNNNCIPLKGIKGETVAFLCFNSSREIINIISSYTSIGFAVVSTLLFSFIIIQIILAYQIRVAMRKRLERVIECFESIKDFNFSVKQIEEKLSAEDHLALIADRVKSLTSYFANSLSLDPLTRVYNRSFFFKRFREEFERAKRYKRPLSFCIFDLDNFKNINDTYGHIIGDEVLRKPARIIKEYIRSLDVLGRIGGEEFAIVMPETKLEDAVNVAERLRRLIEDIEISTHAGTIKITASFGVTEMKESDTMETLMERADRALYIAKKKGKNRVEVL